MTANSIANIELTQNDKNEFLVTVMQKLTTEGLTLDEAWSIVEIFKMVYTDDFRHQYSTLTGYMLQLEQSDYQALRTLSDNLDLYADFFINADVHNMAYTKGVTKFVDHLSLEKARLFRVGELYTPLQQEANRMKEEIVSSQDLLQSTKHSVENIKIDLVAMLGVFSGIILAFMGGISFSNSMLEGLGKVSIHRLIVVAAVCGLVLINTVTLIMHYISNIVYRGERRPRGTTVIFWVTNIVFILIIIGTTVLYFMEHKIIFFS